MSWLFRSRKKPPSATAPKASLDQQTLQQLAKAGGNLAMSTNIINYLYLPDEARARTAAAELEQAGYQVEVRRAAQGPLWLALAKIDMVPSPENIALLRDRFETLASRLGGDFDGWEAAVTH
jgi:Regulator of ribonuclease activity B